MGIIGGQYGGQYGGVERSHRRKRRAVVGVGGWGLEIGLMYLFRREEVFIEVKGV